MNKINDKQIIVIDEFSLKSTSPNAAVLNDFVDNCKEYYLVKHVYFSKNHAPGGLKPRRIINMLLMHIFIPFYLIYLKIKYKDPIVIINTSPPGLHLTVTIINHFLKVKTVVWLFDAHPEIECIFFDKIHLKFLSAFFRGLEKIALNYAYKIICLDNAMKARLETFVINKSKIIVCPPWGTYIQPCKNFIQNHIQIPPPEKILIQSTENPVRMIYAGNYGKLHCLKEFAYFLEKITINQQQEIIIDFIGLNQDGAERIKKIFLNLKCSINFLPRKNSVFEVIKLFPNYHFGIVCLNPIYQGLCCPSKALTYVSQGLPIYYIGPKQTLTSEICQEGFGLEHSGFSHLPYSEWKNSLNNFLKNITNGYYPEKKEDSIYKLRNIFKDA